MRLTLQKKLEKINSYLLMAVAFSIPISTALPFILSGFITLNWLLIADFKNDWIKVKNNPIVLSVFVFLCFVFLALLWSEYLSHGISFTIRKEAKLLLIPIFILFISPQHLKSYIIAFLVGVSISELFTYLIFFNLIEPFMHSTPGSPAPFLSHITYSPIIAFAIYIMSHLALFSKDISKSKKTIYFLFVLTMTFNLFISGGRAGQVMFFGIVFLLFFQYFYKSKTLAIFSSLTLSALLFSLFYYTIPNFKNRVDLGYSNIINFQDSRNTSVGLRLSYAINSFEIIKMNPFFGTGTGGFKENYKTINEKNTPTLESTKNPHNMYTFVLVEQGLVGLWIFLSIFFFQIKHALKQKEIFFRHIGVAFPLLFLLIMLSESYLLISNTLFLFILFSAVLYKDAAFTTKKKG